MDVDGYCYYIGIGEIFNLGRWEYWVVLRRAGDAPFLDARVTLP